MRSIARRIVDPNMLWLIKQWLTAAVENDRWGRDTAHANIIRCRLAPNPAHGVLLRR
jgi:hypothetical protein